MIDKVEIDRIEVVVIKSGISIKLTNSEVIQLLTKLNQDRDWHERMKAVNTSKEGSMVYRGTCPFPMMCNSWGGCSMKECNADVCDGGYVYKYS